MGRWQHRIARTGENILEIPNSIGPDVQTGNQSEALFVCPFARLFVCLFGDFISLLFGWVLFLSFLLFFPPFISFNAVIFAIYHFWMWMPFMQVGLATLSICCGLWWRYNCVGCNDVLIQSRWYDSTSVNFGSDEDNQTKKKRKSKRIRKKKGKRKRGKKRNRTREKEMRKGKEETLKRCLELPTDQIIILHSALFYWRIIFFSLFYSIREHRRRVSSINLNGFSIEWTRPASTEHFIKDTWNLARDLTGRARLDVLRTAVSVVLGDGGRGKGGKGKGKRGRRGERGGMNFVDEPHQSVTTNSDWLYSVGTHYFGCASWQ